MPAAGGLAPDDAGLRELADLYELRDEIGRGGSAVVYRARDRRLDREVALKAVRLAPALNDRERASEVARLAREARTTARLEHPNIVTVFAVHELRDGLAVAMQYVPGRSLKQLLADEGALDPGRAVRLVAEVAAALAYAHAHGVVHRDVKPENIFVDAASGRALLADFGAARAGDADVRVTRTGATVGTPAYMSPEQIDGGPVDGRADVYSLGLVAWEALTGRRPWAGAGLYQLLHHQKHDALPPIAAVRPAERPPVPLAMEYVVARMLEKRPGARWASAAVVGEQLEHPVLPADYKQWVREHRRRMTEFAARRAASSSAAASMTTAPTERFRPDQAAATAAGLAGAGAPALRADGDHDAPSWARPRVVVPWRRHSGGVVASAAALISLVAWMRNTSPRSDVRSRPDARQVANGVLSAAPPGATPGATPGAASAATAGPLPAESPSAGGATPASAVADTEGPPAAPRGSPARGEAASAPAPVAPALAAPLLVAPAPAAPTPGGGALGTDTGRRVVVRLATPPRQGADAPRTAAPDEAPRPASVLVQRSGGPAPVPEAARAAVPAAALGVPAPPGEGTISAARPVVRASAARVAAGARHTCALDGAGRALCWGANESGQLGAGDLTGRDLPTYVAGELRFTQVATGGAHSCALTADGSAHCWGDNDHGQLGAVGALRDTPTRVSGAGRFRALHAGLDHTCALTTAAGVACWGANDRGQLGEASRRDRATPAPVPGVRAAALTVGWRHACALTPEGVALCWGDNADGQLGDGSRAPRSAPVLVAGGRRFVAIAAGARHSCAVAADGGTYCWGAGGAGESAHPTPVRVAADVPFVALAAGSVHTCGLTAGGLVLCWGRNPYGQLGDGSTADHWRPTRVPGGPYTAVSAAGAHTCAMADGTPRCWGYNVSGQLGDGTRAHHATPERVAPAGQ